MNFNFSEIRSQLLQLSNDFEFKYIYVNGVRKYDFGLDKLMGVTSILNSVNPNAYLTKKKVEEGEPNPYLERGRAVHKYIELYAQGEEEFHVEDAYLGYWNSVFPFIYQIKEYVVGLEITVRSSLGYAGMVDCLYWDTEEGCLCLIDWKTSSGKSNSARYNKNYKAQVLAYAYAVNECYGKYLEEVGLGKVQLVKIGIIKPDSFEIVDFRDRYQEYWDYWLTSLNTYNEYRNFT